MQLNTTYTTQCNSGYKPQLVGTNPRPLKTLSDCQTIFDQMMLAKELIIAKTVTQCQCTRFIVNLASTKWALNKLIFEALLKIYRLLRCIVNQFKIKYGQKEI